jgi:UPF0755 protein
VTDLDDPEVYDLYDEDEHRALERSRRRRVVLLVLLLVVVPLGVIGAVGAWCYWQLDPPGDPGVRVEVEVRRGWGVPEIAEELSDRDVVGSAMVFQAYSRLQGAGPFQAGHYTLREDLGVRGAVDVLEAGPTVRAVDLKVVPGLRLEEIANEVENQVDWLDARKFLDAAGSGEVRSKFQPEGSTNLEGLLWPDTYKVSEGEDEVDVLGTMVAEFDERATAAGLEGANVRDLGPYDLVKVASLVQSEAKLDADRPPIASVIYNRLDDDMLLQIDATVLYATHKRSGITEADLDTDSPYNTYVVKGLPPTPIAGVTEASLRAALQPADTGFFYYVIATPEGGHKFAVTYDEHVANIDEARAKGLL